MAALLFLSPLLPGLLPTRPARALSLSSSPRSLTQSHTPHTLLSPSPLRLPSSPHDLSSPPARPPSLLLSSAGAERRRAGPNGQPPQQTQGRQRASGGRRAGGGEGSSGPSGRGLGNRSGRLGPSSHTARPTDVYFSQDRKNCFKLMFLAEGREEGQEEGGKEESCSAAVVEVAGAVSS